MQQYEKSEKCWSHKDQPTLQEKSLTNHFTKYFILGMYKLWKTELNKKPMGHIGHLRKQFKSINTYYKLTLIKRRKKTLLTL